MKMYFLSFLLLWTSVVFGQNSADNQLAAFIKANQPDSFIIVKSGCSNCVFSFEQVEKTKDTLNIKLLYRKKGEQYFVVFSDTAKESIATKVNSSAFNYVVARKAILQKKNQYYKESKKAVFQSPCLTSFPYETIHIKMGQFNYKHTLANRETDDCGTYLSQQEWFHAEIEILKYFDDFRP